MFILAFLMWVCLIWIHRSIGEHLQEPDMELMTGQFMVTSWEALWEYHNLVAVGVKNKLGSRESMAPARSSAVVPHLDHIFRIRDVQAHR